MASRYAVLVNPVSRPAPSRVKTLRRSTRPPGKFSFTRISTTTVLSVRSAGYNLISVPRAAGVLAPIGFVMPMSLGALLMSVSTVIVALNAQLLRRLDLRPDTVVPSTPNVVTRLSVSDMV